MGCIIKLMTKVSADSGLAGLSDGKPDRYGDVLVFTPVGEVESAKGERGEDLHTPASPVDYDTVTDLVLGTYTDSKGVPRGLDAAGRKALADLYNSAKGKRLTAAELNGKDSFSFVSNATPEDLFNHHHISRTFYKIPEGLVGERFTILDVGGMADIGSRYSGMIVKPNGERIVLVRNQYEAIRFLNYLTALDALRSGVPEEGFDEKSVTWRNRETLSKIADERYGRDRNVTLRHMLLDFLDRANDFGDMKIDGRTVNAQRVLNETVKEITGRHFISKIADLDDFQTALWQASGQNDAYKWVIGKRELYDTIARYVPDFESGTKVEDFMRMNHEGMEELLFGEKGVLRGLGFVGGMSLKVVEKTEIRNEGGTTKQKDFTEKAKQYLKGDWARLTEGLGENDPLKVGFSEFDKAEMTLEERNAALRRVGATMTDNDGTVREISAVENNNGVVDYVVKYTLDVPVAESYGKSSVVMQSPYELIGEMLKFGYDTEYVLDPVDNVDMGKYGVIKGGRYHGMLVYSGVNSRGETVYYISRHIMNPKLHGRPYITLDEALDGIDRENAFGKLSESAFVSLKQGARKYWEEDIECGRLEKGQVLTVLDWKLSGKTGYDELPAAVKSLFDVTAGGFHELFKEVVGEDVLHTPEMCATYLMEQYEALHDALAGVLDRQSVVKAMVENHKADRDAWNDMARRITGAGKVSYYVSDVWRKGGARKSGSRTEARFPVLQGNLVLLKDRGKGLNAKGDRVGNVRVGDFVKQSMDRAVDFIGREMGNVVRTDIERMRGMEVFSGVSDEMLGEVRAFFHDGDIYINTSGCDEADLYEEVTHLLLGVLKVRDPEAYRAEVFKLYDADSKAGAAFRGRVTSLRKRAAYSGLALQDLVEEQYAKDMARALARSVDLHVVDEWETNADGVRTAGLGVTGGGFDEDVFRRTLGYVLEKVKGFYMEEAATSAEMKDLGFLGWARRVNSSSEGRSRRVVANVIRNLIDRTGKDRRGMFDTIREVCE